MTSHMQQNIGQERMQMWHRTGVRQVALITKVHVIYEMIFDRHNINPDCHFEHSCTLTVTEF